MRHFGFTTTALLILAVLLTGCAAVAPTGGVDRSDPAAVNAAWVDAVRNNDREAAMALYDAGSAEANAFNVAKALDKMALYMTVEAGKWPGTFQTVEVLDVREVGAGRQAYSRWVFSKETLCYYAAMSQQDGAWVVTSWLGTDSDDCES